MKTPERLIALLSKVKTGKVNWKDQCIKLNGINGLGLSTYTKFLYFLKVSVNSKKALMMDRDLAALYGVETRVLVQAVNRNRVRFPKEFFFQLNKKEFAEWRSQIVMSKADKKGLRRAPYAFTEQGVAMLSSVLLGKKWFAFSRMDKDGLEVLEKINEKQVKIMREELTGHKALITGASRGIGEA